MGALLVANCISVRHYFLAVENLPSCANDLTYLPCFFGYFQQGSGASVIDSSNFSSLYFRTFILRNYSIAIMIFLFPQQTDIMQEVMYNLNRLIEVLNKCGKSNTSNNSSHCTKIVNNPCQYIKEICSKVNQFAERIVI